MTELEKFQTYLQRNLESLRNALVMEPIAVEWGTHPHLSDENYQSQPVLFFRGFRISRATVGTAEREDGSEYDRPGFLIERYSQAERQFEEVAAAPEPEQALELLVSLLLESLTTY